jgi:hypothetical protein
MNKPTKRVDLSKLTSEQRAAFIQFVKDCQQAAPQVKEMQQTAQEVFDAWVRSPEWGISEGERPESAPRQSLWHVGAPQVNYVDHIERPEKQ